MQSVGTVLTLDFLRKGRVHFLQLLATPVWSLLLYMVLRRIAPLETRELRFLFFMTLLMEALIDTVMLGALQSHVNAANLHGGFPRRLYTLPVSTARLVFWQVLPALALISLIHIYIAIFIRLITGVMPPVVEPILFLMMIYSGAMMVIWALPGFVVLRLVGIAIVAFLPGLWFNDAYAPRIHHLVPGQVWAPPALSSFFWMPLATVAAYGIAVWGVARDRRGETWNLDGLKAAWAGLLERAPERRRPFASARAAQFWFEWRQKGLAMPAGALLLSAVVPAIVLCVPENKWEDALMALCGLPFYYVLPASLLLGILMGLTNPKGGGNELDLFRATRPVSDAALASAMHKVGFTSILASTAICVAAALAMSAGMTLLGHGDHVLQTWQYWAKDFGVMKIGLWDYTLALALMLLGAWILFSLATVLGQTGHGKLMAGLTIGGCMTAITTCLVQFWIPTQITLWIVHAVLIALGSAFLIGGGGAFLICRRRRMFTPMMIGAAFVTWLFFAGMGMWALMFVNLHTPWPVSFFWLGVLTLAPATPFMGAVAMGWNRHR